MTDPGQRCEKKGCKNFAEYRIMAKIQSYKTVEL
jgi:hypothetical protein